MMDKKAANAVLDNNFGLFKIIPREGKKPEKVPMDLETGVAPVAKDAAFVYPFEVAKAALNGGSSIVGYLPVPISEYVGLDLDMCLDKEGQMLPWAADILGDYSGLIAVTPSGKGLRILQPRVDGDEEHNSGEANDVGFFADGGKGFTVPLGALGEGIYRDEGMVQRLLARKGQTGHGVSLHAWELAAKQTGDERKWGSHWLSKLQPGQQREAIVEMLGHLPTKHAEERDLWLKVTIELKDLESRLSPDGWWNVAALWDEWSRTAESPWFSEMNKYNEIENEKTWNSVSKDGRRTIFSLLHDAEPGGFDKRPWMQLARMQEAVLHQPQEADEVIEEPVGEPVDLTRPAGLLGKIIDYGELTSNRHTRFFGLTGGLAAMSALSMHRWVVKSPAGRLTPLNLHVLAAAGTGMGKEEARDRVKEAAEVSTFGNSGPPASDAGLHTLLTQNKRQMIMIDEFGRYLASQERGSHEYKLMSMLMQLHTSAMGSLPERTYSNVAQNKPAVLHPFVCGLHTTTPEVLLEAFSSNTVTDGVLGRILMLTQKGRPPLRNERVRPNADALRDEVKEGMQRIADYLPPKVALDDMRNRPSFEVITLEPDAENFLWDTVRPAFDVWAAEPNIVAALWSRAFEMVLRIAGVCAIGCADDLSKITVSLEVAKWAAHLVEYSITSNAPDVEEYASEGEFDGLRKSILNTAAKADGWVRRSEVIKTCKGARRPYKVVGEELDGLIDVGLLAVKMDGDKVVQPCQIKAVGGATVGRFLFDIEAYCPRVGGGSG